MNDRITTRFFQLNKSGFSKFYNHNKEIIGMESTSRILILKKSKNPTDQAEIISLVFPATKWT